MKLDGDSGQADSPGYGSNPAAVLIVDQFNKIMEGDENEATMLCGF